MNTTVEDEPIRDYVEDPPLSIERPVEDTHHWPGVETVVIPEVQDPAAFEAENPVEDTPSPEDLEAVRPFVEEVSKKALRSAVILRNRILRAAGVSKMKLEQLRRAERSGNQERANQLRGKFVEEAEARAAARVEELVEDGELS